MSDKLFDRETMLDLSVNIIPLVIMGFFVIVFIVVAPFGFDPMASALQFGLLVVPLVLLAILTYFSGVAIAGTERSDPLYLPGQASVRGAVELEHPGESPPPQTETDPVAVEE
jgi:hypothetical protein